MSAVRAAGVFVELALHGLAHLPLRGPERLFDPRYLATLAGWPAEAREPLATDAPKIAAELERTSASLAVQWLPLLHADLDAFLRTGARELAALGEADADPIALAALRRPASPAIEWLRTDLLLVAEGFAARHSPPSAEDCAALAEVLAPVPARERPAEVILSQALGPRGRGFPPDVVVVGAPAPWWCEDDVDRRIPAVLALHEHAVVRAPGDHAAREWRALTELAARMARYPAPLRAAHARWLASLELDDIAPASLRAVLADRSARAATLAQASSGVPQSGTT